MEFTCGPIGSCAVEKVVLGRLFGGSTRAFFDFFAPLADIGGTVRPVRLFRNQMSRNSREIPLTFEEALGITPSRPKFNVFGNPRFPTWPIEADCGGGLTQDCCDLRHNLVTRPRRVFNPRILSFIPSLHNAHLLLRDCFSQR